MNADLYDFSPLAWLLLLGALLAAVPLLALLWRHRHASPARRRLALVSLTLFLTFDLVLVGSFTRLSDSGLGCPDWPGCYSHASPVGAMAQIAAEQAVRPDGPVTHRKAWIEMIHRYLATALGALITCIAVLAWRDSRLARAAASRAGAGMAAVGRMGPPAWLPWVTLGWVCVQGLFGALTVTMKLQPAIVTLHLIGGYILIALLVLQVLAWSRAAAGPQARSLAEQVPAGLRGAVLAALALLMLQAASGAWVSTNYAVLACTDFPTCRGQWWPQPDWSGFELWRPLGARGDGQLLDMQALVTIHQAHRALAIVTVLALLALWHRLRDVAALARPRRWLLGLLGLQVLTGVSNVVLDWPLLAAVLHTGGAGGLTAVLVWMGAALPVGRTLNQAAGASAAASVAARTPEVAPAAAPHGPGAAASTPAESVLPLWRQFHVLTKPRVIQLIVFCALIGMVLAVPGWPDARQWLRMLWACIGIYLVAGAAAAFNCVIEKRIDARMRRTAWRPTARGQLGDGMTLLFSATLCALGSAVLLLGVNGLTTVLCLATFIGYAVIYTVILKPLTPQNIVIGGASGAMPPVLGWAAMTGEVGPESLILCLIIFLWTPPHFWALALYRVEDYRKSGLPMLPVTHGNEFTRLQILLYTLILFAACLMPFLYGMSGWLYLAAALVLNFGFMHHAVRLWKEYSDALARKTFRFSLIHLSALFAALLVDHYIPRL